MTDAAHEPDFALTTPSDVASDPQAVEIMRLWWSRGVPVMTLKPAFNDPTRFGEVLAQAARHMSRVYEMQRGMNGEDSYKAILKGLEQTLAGPEFDTLTEQPGGGAA
ncbi:MAG: DUF5076 domain-containing protein [Caulobacterales bacterium]|nr:DUF5076 domain-containing protein [Caulobacterales bacterium]